MRAASGASTNCSRGPSARPPSWTCKTPWYSANEIKIPLYARAGIPEAWVVDVAAERIEVYEDPIAEQYTRVRTASRGDVLTPLQFPNVTVAADEILG